MDLIVPSSSSTRKRGLPNDLMHKNRLQEFTQRSSIKLPIYQTINEGVGHAPMFRATVLVDGATYTSPNTFSHRKAAEQDVARLALACIIKKIKAEGCPLISEDTIFCKSILGEFAVKMNLEKPTYHTIQIQGLLPVFMSSLVFKGVTYTGAPSRNKKEAEQLAARAAVLSILGDSNSEIILSEIIKSKFRLYAALYKIKDCGNAYNGFETLRVHSGNGQDPGNSDGISLDKGKEVGSTNTFLPIANSEACLRQITNLPLLSHPYDFKTLQKDQTPENNGRISLGKGKEVEGTSTLPAIAVSEACSGQVTNHPVLLQPFHKFKTPKQELPAEAIAPPIVFVPPVLQLQPPLGAASSCSKKRKRKNKKRGNMKSCRDAK